MRPRRGHHGAPQNGTAPRERAGALEAPRTATDEGIPVETAAREPPSRLHHAHAEGSQTGPERRADRGGEAGPEAQRRHAAEDGRGAGLHPAREEVGGGRRATGRRRKITSDPRVVFIGRVPLSSSICHRLLCCKRWYAGGRSTATRHSTRIACCTEQRFKRCKGAQDAYRLCINRSRCDNQR